MSDEIRPALTPEEWAERLDPDSSPFPRPQDREYEYWGPAHEVAALALYKQPFGFTHADVRMLRRLHRDVRLTHEDMQTGEITEPLESLAARIEALLPPKA
jgi:hypothetical protein